MPASLVTSTNWDSVGLLVGFGLSIPVFFATAYGWVLWYTGPLVVHRYTGSAMGRPNQGRLSPRPEGVTIVTQEFTLLGGSFTAANLDFDARGPNIRPSPPTSIASPWTERSRTRSCSAGCRNIYQFNTDNPGEALAMKKQIELIVGFLPLIAFSLLAKVLPSGDIGIAGLIAALLAMAVMLTSRPVWPPKILNACSFVLFAVLAILGFSVGKGDDSWLATWTGAGEGIIIGVVILLLVPRDAVHRAVRKGS